MPLQAPTSSSATIHWSAPSPNVYPVDPVYEQRHSSEGDDPHTLVSKLTSTKDSKHVKAHDGMKSVISEPRSNGYDVEDAEGADVVAVALTARTCIVVAHSNSSLVLLATSILWDNIYLLDEITHVLVEIHRYLEIIRWHGADNAAVLAAHRHHLLARGDPADARLRQPVTARQPIKGSGRDVRYPPTFLIQRRVGSLERETGERGHMD